MTENSTDSIPKSGFFSLPRYQRITCYLLAIYFLYAALFGLVAPQLIKHYAPDEITKLTNRTATLEDVSINPFTLAVEIQGLTINELEAKPFISFEQFKFQFNLWKSAFNGAINIEHLSLEGLNTNVIQHADGTFNFTSILDYIEANKQPAPEPKEAKPEGEMPLIQIASVSLINNALVYADENTGAVLSYPAINFSLINFNSRALTSSKKFSFNDFNINIVGVDKSELQTSGKFQLSPLQAEGELALNNIQLETFWAFVENQFEPKLNSGAINFTTDYYYSLADEQLVLNTNKGHFTLTDVNFTNQKNPLLNLPKLAVNDINVDVAKQQVKIDSITTQGLQLHTKIDKDGADLATLFSPKSTENATQAKGEKSTPKSDTDTPPWLVTLGSFDLENYDLRISESVVTDATDWQIAPLNLSTKSIKSDLSEPIDYKLAFQVNKKGLFASSGKIDAKKESINAKLALTGFHLAQLQPYLAPYVNIDLKDGQFNLSGHLSADASTERNFAGDLSVTDLTINDHTTSKRLLSWKSLALESIDFNQVKNAVVVKNISLASPYAQVIVENDKTVNLNNIVVKDDEKKIASEQNNAADDKAITEADSSGDKKADMLIEIDHIEVTKGQFDFIDNSLTPRFTSKVDDLEAKIGTISSTATKNANLDITAQVNDYAPLVLKGEINPLVEYPYLDLDFTFDNFELPSLTPYSSDKVGLDIDEGQLHLALNYKLQEEVINGSNKIIVDQLDLNDSANTDAAPLVPVTLALPLLTDSNGVIDLDVNIEGNVNDPSFNISELVLNALRNIIVKAVSSPFSLLAGLVESDEQLDTILFPAGSDFLSIDEQTKISTLAKALEKRPDVKLNIKGSFDNKEDKLVLAQMQLNEKIGKEAKADAANISSENLPKTEAMIDALLQVHGLETKVNPQALREQLVTDNPDLNADKLNQKWYSAIYSQAVNAQVIDTAQLNELARSRANAVKNQLKTANNVDTKRIFVLTHQKQVESNAKQAKLTLVVK